MENNTNMKIRITASDIQNMVRECVNYILRESVYINKLNDKNKTASLTYKKGSDWSNGNLVTTDKLKTDKMDMNNGDTYEVKLKGGLTCYNITSINGTEVMHYFKNYFSNKDAEIEVNDVTYKLKMQRAEFQNFLDQFIQKIGFVIDYCIKGFDLPEDFSQNGKISLYPVKSSSNFNEKMCEEMKGLSLYGLPIQLIDKDLLSKDLRNLQKDEDFINKNKEYYSGRMSQKDAYAKSVETYLDNDITKYKALEKANPHIENMNRLFNELKAQYYNYNNMIKSPSSEGVNYSRRLTNMANNYMEYCDEIALCLKDARYTDITKDKEDVGFNINSIANKLKYSKGPSIENRTDAIWDIVKPLLRGKKSPVTGKPYTKQDVNGWEKNKFQIKKISNGERMGLKNIYSPNMDADLVQREVEKAKGTIFVIFDDNVSGGATLSDVCYQLQQLGIENIIPITFGQMNESWSIGKVPLIQPVNNNGEHGFNY